MTETRTLWKPIHDGRTATLTDITQQPIPWCTTHDDIAAKSGDRCRGFSYYGTKWDINECVISSGGTDHKWWKDIE